MCIMMLHFHHRKSQFFRDHHRIVLWMHITAYNLRLYFQQCFHPSDSLLKCFYRSQIFQISDIWGRIKSVIHTNAEEFLSSPPCASTCPPWCGNHKRKRCIPSGTSDHIGFCPHKNPSPNRPHGYGSSCHGTGCSHRDATVPLLLPDHLCRLAHRKYFHWSLPETRASGFHHHMKKKS